MPIIVSFLGTSNASAANVDRYPEACPVCQVRAMPRFVAATIRAPQVRQICFQCSDEHCRSLFVATYLAETTLSFRLASKEPETA
jgi:hypothetical protein